jgi:hypothetical protein
MNVGMFVMLRLPPATIGIPMVPPAIFSENLLTPW